MSEEKIAFIEVSEEERMNNIMVVLSDVMGVKITYHPLAEDQGKVYPAFDVNAIISKLIAFLVFRGLSVPSTFAPSYNRVNADIEWWKKEFVKKEDLPKADIAVSDVPSENSAENSA